MNAYALGQLSFYVILIVIGLAVIWFAMRSSSTWAKLAYSIGVVVLVLIVFLNALPSMNEDLRKANLEEQRRQFAMGARESCGRETLANFFPELDANNVPQSKADEFCDCMVETWSSGYSPELGMELEAGNWESNLVLEMVQRTYENCPVAPVNIDAPEDMHPYYQRIFYTRLKQVVDRDIPAAANPANEQKVAKLLAAIEAAQISKSYVSHVNAYAPDDMQGRALIWRIDYAAPDQFHVIQLMGEDIDEWVIVGPRAWYGPIWIEEASDAFVHADAHANVAVMGRLKNFVEHASQADRKILVSDDEKTFRILGPFSDFAMVPDLVLDAREVDFHLGDGPQISRMDIWFEVPGGDPPDLVSFRYAFGAWGQDVRIVIPEPAATMNEKGELIITSETIQQLPFYEFRE